MNEKELKKLIKFGESQNLEFKKSFDKEVIETAVAFSNSSGGIILVGIDDKGKFGGLALGKKTYYALFERAHKRLTKGSQNISKNVSKRGGQKMTQNTGVKK